MNICWSKHTHQVFFTVIFIRFDHFELIQITNLAQFSFKCFLFLSQNDKSPTKIKLVTEIKSTTCIDETIFTVRDHKYEWMLQRFGLSFYIFDCSKLKVVQHYVHPHVSACISAPTLLPNSSAKPFYHRANTHTHTH